MIKKYLDDDVCDEGLFEALFKKHLQEIHNFLSFRYGERFNPSDMVQEAFIKLWENCAEVRPDKARGFLYKVANNLTLNEVKHQKVVLKHTQDQPKKVSKEDPEFILEEKEYLKKYNAALSKLSEVQRTAFLLCRVEGKKHHEVAEIQGITVRAARKRIYTAIENLRKEIDGI